MTLPLPPWAAPPRPTDPDRLDDAVRLMTTKLLQLERYNGVGPPPAWLEDDRAALRTILREANIVLTNQYRDRADWTA